MQPWLPTAFLAPCPLWICERFAWYEPCYLVAMCLVTHIGEWTSSEICLYTILSHLHSSDWWKTVDRICLDPICAENRIRALHYDNWEFNKSCNIGVSHYMGNKYCLQNIPNVYIKDENIAKDWDVTKCDRV